MSAGGEIVSMGADAKRATRSTGSWHVAIDLDHGVTVHSHDGVPICRMGGNISQINIEANAHRIVDSVNAHDALVEACKLFAMAAHDARDALNGAGLACPSSIAFAAERARAALAKAGQ
jgi:hypothetical protein